MAEVHYGVVRQGGRWRIIGNHLRFGAYRSRNAAVRAARKLAEQSPPTGVLHMQDESGELLPPERVPPEEPEET